ncbi:MAG TPA: hypothetical protein VEN81_15190, partial [Planctomycetota bacterium]|nr:hypothetical protein [Planctomycetota bacterium]
MVRWSGMARAAAAAAFLAGATLPAESRGFQEAHSPDWRKCKICAPALAKAMAYLKANLRSDKAKRVIGSKLGGYVFGG